MTAPRLDTARLEPETTPLRPPMLRTLAFFEARRFFPGAALIAASVLIGWTLIGTAGLAMSASRLGTLAVLALASLALTVASDPARTPV